VKCLIRLAVVVSISLLFYAVPTVAQVEIDGVHLSAGGDLSAGYNGDFGSTGGSDHGLTLGGSGSLGGYYYNPNFASFSVSPYYGRSQANSASTSIQDSSGYNGVVNLFAGSYFPTGITFSQIWNSTGNFGIPGSTGLATDASSHSFGIGTNLLFPGLPSVLISYTQSSGTSSVYGSEGENAGSTRSFTVRSGYKLGGFTLGGSFAHLSSEESSNILVGSGGAPDVIDTDVNTFSVSAAHSLPLHGAFGINFGRSNYSYSGSEFGDSENGVTDNAGVNASIKLGIFPINSTVTYTDNLFGSVLQQQLSNGTPVYQTTLSPESRSLLITANTSYVLARRIFITGYVSHQDQFIFGQSYGVTQFGANANYHFGRRFKGLTVTLGVNDAANKEGNLGAGLVANVNYSNKLGGWYVWGNYNYDQNVQTLLVIYTISSMNYSVGARRRLPKGINWTVGAGSGHSGFGQQKGNSSQAASFSSSLNWHGYSLGGNYSMSNGTSVLTPQGLVTLTAPIVSANELVVYDAHSYGLGASANPVRNLLISASYSDARSTTVGQSVLNNRNMLINGLCTYRFRKLSFIAGATRFRQSLGLPSLLSAVGPGPVAPIALNSGMVTTYYFGISRWFKAF